MSGGWRGSGGEGKGVTERRVERRIGDGMGGEGKGRKYGQKEEEGEWKKGSREVVGRECE